MLDSLAKSIRASIRAGGCARLQEPFLKSVYTIADRETPFDTLLSDFCEQYGFCVHRDSGSPVFIFTLP
jgi:hypothetical protein